MSEAAVAVVWGGGRGGGAKARNTLNRSYSNLGYFTSACVVLHGACTARRLKTQGIKGMYLTVPDFAKACALKGTPVSLSYTWHLKLSLALSMYKVRTCCLVETRNIF